MKLKKLLGNNLDSDHHGARCGALPYRTRPLCPSLPSTEPPSAFRGKNGKGLYVDTRAIIQSCCLNKFLAPIIKTRLWGHDKPCPYNLIESILYHYRRESPFKIEIIPSRHTRLAYSPDSENLLPPGRFSSSSESLTGLQCVSNEA